jgi:hypothetical protein
MNLNFMKKSTNFYYLNINFIQNFKFLRIILKFFSKNIFISIFMNILNLDDLDFLLYLSFKLFIHFKFDLHFNLFFITIDPL